MCMCVTMCKHANVTVSSYYSDFPNLLLLDVGIDGGDFCGRDGGEAVENDGGGYNDGNDDEDGDDDDDVFDFAITGILIRKTVEETTQASSRFAVARVVTTTRSQFRKPPLILDRCYCYCYGQFPLRPTSLSRVVPQL